MTIAMSGGSERAKINLLELAQRLGAQYRVDQTVSIADRYRVGEHRSRPKKKRVIL